LKKFIKFSIMALSLKLYLPYTILKKKAIHIEPSRGNPVRKSSASLPTGGIIWGL
jgi:hypothetical protein